MAKWWLGVTLTVAGLGAAVSARAQNLPAPGTPPAAKGSAADTQPGKPPATTDTPPATPESGVVVPPPGTGGIMVPGPGPGDHLPPVEGLAPPGPIGAGGDAGPVNGFTVDQHPGIPPERFHADFEYLLWFVRRQQFPALATTGLASDPIPGALGQTSTQVLVSGGDVDKSMHSGGRLTLSYDLDCDQIWNVNVSGFWLETQGGSSALSSDGSVVLSRPFFDPVNNIENADPVALPNVSSGSLLFSTYRRFYGADANLNFTYVSQAEGTVALIGILGPRYLALDEGFTADEVTTDLPGTGTAGNTTFIEDKFKTINRFYGGQVGAEAAYRMGMVSMSLLGQVALGTTIETVRTSGFTQVTAAGGATTTSFNEGFLVQPTNAGNFGRSHFTYVPELRARIGIDFNEYVRLWVGYNYLYWSDVARPGDQIDRRINIQPLNAPAIVPPALPSLSVQSRGFWAQGLDVGLLISF